MNRELYCQNPYCGKVITEKRKMVNIDGSLVHDGCEPGYIMGKCVQTKKTVTANSKPVFYQEGLKLAEEGKVKFSKLEIASVGGIRQ